MYCNYILQLCSKLLFGHWPYSVYLYICTWPLAINFADMPVNILSFVMFKLCLLLYFDDVVIMPETEVLKHGLFLLEDYCDRCKLTVNATKTKVIIFRKEGRVNRNIRFI